MRRGDFLRRAALGSAAFAAGGALAAPAKAAAPSDDELSYANFAIASELMLADFYGRVLRAGVFHGATAGALSRARFNETEHARALTNAIVAAGQPAPVDEDFEFTWPAKVFASKGAAAALGLKLEQTLVGVYLQGVVVTENPDLRVLMSRIVASDAEHAAVLAGVARGKSVGNSFPEPIDLETASEMVGPYQG